MTDHACAIEVWRVVGLATRKRGAVGGFDLVVEASGHYNAVCHAVAWLRARHLEAVNGTIEAHRCTNGERALARWTRDVLAVAKARA